MNWKQNEGLQVILQAPLAGLQWLSEGISKVVLQALFRHPRLTVQVTELPSTAKFSTNLNP